MAAAVPLPQGGISEYSGFGLQSKTTFRLRVMAGFQSRIRSDPCCTRTNRGDKEPCACCQPSQARLTNIRAEGRGKRKGDSLGIGTVVNSVYSRESLRWNSGGPSAPLEPSPKYNRYCSGTMASTTSTERSEPSWRQQGG